MHPDNAERSVLATHLQDTLTRHRIVVFSRPLPKDNVFVHIDSFDLQNKKLPPELIRQLFVFMSTRGNSHVMTTEASKSVS